MAVRVNAKLTRRSSSVCLCELSGLSSSEQVGSDLALEFEFEFEREFRFRANSRRISSLGRQTQTLAATRRRLSWSLKPAPLSCHLHGLLAGACAPIKWYIYPANDEPQERRAAQMSKSGRHVSLANVVSAASRWAVKWLCARYARNCLLTPIVLRTRSLSMPLSSSRKEPTRKRANERAANVIGAGPTSARKFRSFGQIFINARCSMETRAATPLSNHDAAANQAAAAG